MSGGWSRYERGGGCGGAMAVMGACFILLLLASTFFTPDAEPPKRYEPTRKAVGDVVI